MGENLIELHHVNCKTTFLVSWFWDYFSDAVSAVEENESNQVDILLQFNLVFLSDEVKALLDQELGLDGKKRFSKLNCGRKTFRLTSDS